MKSPIRTKTTKAIARPVHNPAPRKISPGWKPQVPNLTRDEMRAIVIDLIG
ncbi:MAG: hypothetical protein ABWY78_16375 [Microvirga sp.]